MKVVLDTNVWLSGIFWQGEAYKLIKAADENEIQIVMTRKILFEIVHVLNKEAKFQKFIRNRNIAIEDLVRTIISMTQLVASRSRLNVIREHINDNRILESAVDGNVDYLVSYDNHLLKLRSYKSIKILSPTDFLKKL